MAFLVDLLYPPLCIHCEKKLEKKRILFCSLCLSLLSLADPHERCKTCFAEVKGKCERCISRPVVVQKQAAACESMGPAWTLYSHVLRGEHQYLPTLIPLFLLQYAALDWPRPDYIIPLQRGPDRILAQKIGQQLGISVLFAFKLKWGRFRLKKGIALSEKRILLVTLHLEDSVIRRAAEALQDGFPLDIRALAFIT